MEPFKVTAPTRVDLAGGTLDIWPLYCLTGGAKTINVALGLQATAHFECLPAVSFRAEIQSGTENFGFDEPISLAAAKRLAPALQFPVAVVSSYLSQKPYLPEKCLRIRVETEAPLRSGLGGSSALCVALARGLSRVFDDYVEQGWQWALLQWVRDLEAAFLNTPTGTQDYLASLFGGLNAFTYQMGRIERLPYSEEVERGLAERLLVLFSGEMHHSGLSNWELYKGALEGNTEVLGGLAALGQVAERLDGELRAANVNWRHVGELLAEEWRIRRTTLHVQTQRLEEITHFLTEQRVLGAKVCGAAQGGSLVALVEPNHKAHVARACEEKGIQVLHAPCAKAGVTIHSATHRPLSTKG